MKKIETRHAVSTAVLALILAPIHLTAGVQQEDGASFVVGVVVDHQTGGPLADARVVLDDGRETRTANDGTFHFRALETGTRRIAAVTRGCHATGGRFELEPGEDALLRLVLDRGDPQPVGNPDVDGATTVISGEQLRSAGHKSLLEVIQGEAPFLTGGNEFGGGHTPLNSRRASRGPMLLLDDTPVTQRVSDVLANLAAVEVVRVEIVRGMGATLRHGDRAAGGLIRVTTRTRRDQVDPGRSADQCAIDWNLVY